MKELGDLIKRVRRSKMLLQDEVAEFMGISRSSYINIEQGRKALKLQEAFDLCEFLDINIKDLQI